LSSSFLPMIDLHQPRMLDPLSFSSDLLTKFPSGHVYLRQPHTVQIIQLTEGPPPSPRHIASGSAASSYDYLTEDSQSSDGDDEDEESVCTSYCSSDLPPEQHKSPLCNDESIAVRPGLSSQTYSTPLKRILAWRENFSSQLSDTLSDHSFSSSLKRKIFIGNDDDQDDDNVSHSSKRSRSQTSMGEGSVVSLDMHSCPACDASFPTPQSLRQHGRDAEATNEACSVAVEYAFE